MKIFAAANRWEKIVKLGYVRPEPNKAEEPQKAALVAAGVSPTKIWTEGRRKAGDEYPALEALTKAIRAKGDLVYVSQFGRLGASGPAIIANLKAIRAKGGVVVEAETGRRSDCQVDLAAMVQEAADGRAGRLTKAEAKERGRAGGLATAAKRDKSGRMSVKSARAIWRDVKNYTSGAEALAKINQGKEGADCWSMAAAYREIGRRQPRKRLGRRPTQ